MCAGVPEDYEVPLQGMVPPDPSFEDMRRVVVVERRQPPIPPRWNAEEVLLYNSAQHCLVPIFINPRRACAARGYGTWVCVSVALNLTSRVFVRLTKDTTYT